MRILTALSVLFITLSSAPAFADLITPDAGTNDDAGTVSETNNGTNAATNNGTAAANNATGGENNATGGGNNDTGGGAETTGGETTETKDEGGCATASGAESLLPALLGLALIGLTRRR